MKTTKGAFKDLKKLHDLLEVLVDVELAEEEITTRKRCKLMNIIRYYRGENAELYDCSKLKR